MELEVGGAGTVGVAFETTLGTYIAPTKWIPIRSESLQQMEDKVWRRNIRGKAEITGAIKGYFHVEGDIVFEVTTDILLYFMYGGRWAMTKTGASAPFTYVFTPVHVAKASTATGPTTRKTLSILTQRSGVPMSYNGLVVSQYAFTIDSGVLICTASMVGTGESPQSTAVATYTANDPFGPGEVTLQIPTATTRNDIDTFDLTINNNAIAQNRLNGQRTAAYVNWGEREITGSIEHDFDTITDFDIFINQTFQTLKLIGNNGVADSLDITLSAAVEESYAVNLSGLGDIVRGAAAYHGIYDTTDSVTVTLVTAESVT